MARTTTTSKAIVLVAEELEPEALAWLAARCSVVRENPDSDAFECALAACRGLVVRTYTQVDEPLLNRAPELRVVARAGVGLDNIDHQACERRGVRVVHTPDANTQSVVEFTLGAILDHVRPRTPARPGLSLADWKSDRERARVEHDLADQTLGIWGLGRIGTRLARASNALGIETIYHDIREIPETERCFAEPVTCDELLARSDILTLHMDGRSENHYLLAAKELARVRPAVLIVNTSRGFVIDSAALAAFLTSNGGARAILDVHDPEPIPSDSPLVGLANATLTPHIAAGTRSAKLAMSWVVRDLWDALREDEPA